MQMTERVRCRRADAASLEPLGVPVASLWQTREGKPSKGRGLGIYKLYLLIWKADRSPHPLLHSSDAHRAGTQPLSRHHLLPPGHISREPEVETERGLEPRHSVWVEVSQVVC